jgi:hypothetical protein
MATSSPAPSPDLEHLATHSWFKILWQYASTYNVKINFHQRFHIPPTRLNDISIVEFFLRNGPQKRATANQREVPGVLDAVSLWPRRNYPSYI